MRKFRGAVWLLLVALLAGCEGGGEDPPAQGKSEVLAEEPIDANDPLYAVALGRPETTLYGVTGDVLVARKVQGRFVLDSVPYTEDFSFRPGQQAPTAEAEAARLRQFRVRELTPKEWDQLRTVVTEQKLLERKPAAAHTRDLRLQVLVCGRQSVLLGWGSGTGADTAAESLRDRLVALAWVDGKPWVRPQEPLPDDAVDKILVVSVGEAMWTLDGGDAWALEASRDREGVWITSTLRSRAPREDRSLVSETRGGETVSTQRFPLTEDEWKGLLAFIRREDLLHWRAPDIQASDGGSAFVTIRTVVDLRFAWDLGLNEAPKAMALKAELQRLHDLHSQSDTRSPR